jgi:RNA recognition motif-containing protein
VPGLGRRRFLTRSLRSNAGMALGPCEQRTASRCASLPWGEPNVNIFVGNLAFTTTEQTLRDLFASYGTVDTVRIMTDRETGRPRGFGFVEMADGTAARAAIAGLQGHELDGRALTVNEARPREERGRPREDRREPRRPRW